MKKIIAIGLAVAVAGVIGSVSAVKAATLEELQEQAAQLQAQLNAILAQIQQLQGGTATTGTVSCTFTRNLYPGMTGPDVKCLQQYLNSAGFKVAETGPGSPGNETEYYGPLTKAAVGAWQDAHGIPYGAYKGYFGPLSRAKYTELMSAAPGEEEEEEEEEEE